MTYISIPSIIVAITTMEIIGDYMRTIQMTLDDNLVYDVDLAVKKLSTNRSAFTREALRAFLDQLNKKESEKKHQTGYKRHPVNQRDFSDWHDEQVWGDNDATW